MDNDLIAFGQGLAGLDLSETDLSVALLWFLEEKAEATEFTAARLGSLIHDLSLRGQVNTSRLTKRLAAHSDVVRGKHSGSFKIKLSRRPALEQKYAPLLRRPAPKVESHVLASDDFLATRRYLETLVFEINGSYQFGFYDGCIVLCRRLMETLLIEAFEHAGKSSYIKQHNHYLQLSEIIAIARGGQHIKLARGSADILEEIKLAGDRTYITKQQDVDDLKLKLRRVISELMHLARIEPSKPTQDKE
jgi:hypothetical protein